MSFELLPFANIQALLGLKEDTIASYPELSIILLGMLSAFEEFTGRQFEQVERTEEIFVNGSKTSIIPLKGLPVVSVSSVTISSTSYGTETLTSADYDITNYGLNISYKVNNCKVSVTYTGGLAATTEALKRAALYQVAYEFQSKEQIGASSVSNEGGSVFRPELGLLKETQRMLESSVHPLKFGTV